MKRLLDVVVRILAYDYTHKQWSHTKLWSNVGYACMSWAFVWAVKYGTSVEYILWVVFGVIVIGNRTIYKVLHLYKGDNNAGSN